MSAVIVERGDTTPGDTPHVAGSAIARGRGCLPMAQVALLGTGNVGQAILARLAGWTGTRFGDALALAYVGNSRTAFQGERLCPAAVQAWFAGGGEDHADASKGFVALRSVELDQLSCALQRRGGRIVIDATASDEVAGRHASWLAQGIHVVTASKLGQGTSLARWRAIRHAAAHGGALYGDSATVGAGLPLLRSVRELQAGGDRIHAIAGVLSGSLAWLFNHYDGVRPFSGFVRQARDAGYTEPDPLEDLSGEDVRRKIVILARAAGVALASDAVEVESLLALAAAAGADAGANADASSRPTQAASSSDGSSGVTPALDALLQQRHREAAAKGAQLRFIARLQDGRATVRLETLDANHPLAAGAGTDNKLAIWSDRYRDQPLVIQGPGAGAEVTAAGLLDDALRIARSTCN
ncbi:MAG: homoserine dehydrogenase [Lysobacter sp.]